VGIYCLTFCLDLYVLSCFCSTEREKQDPCVNVRISVQCLVPVSHHVIIRQYYFKVGEKYSHAQQLFYNCHRMLVFLRHVSTHFPSHLQALHNLKAITFNYLRECVRDLSRTL
jgi:hypothetical protein